MKEPLDIIGLNIRKRRKEMGLSQTELADKAGISLQGINRIETGKRQARKSNLEAIAAALKCSLQDLYREPKEDKLEDPTIEGQAKKITEQAARLELYKKHDELIRLFERVSPELRDLVLLLISDDPAFADDQRKLELVLLQDAFLDKQILNPEPARPRTPSPQRVIQKKKSKA